MASFLRNLRKQNAGQLLQASDSGNEELVNRLISQKADLSVCDSQGNTALHLAAFSGHDIIVSMLLKTKMKCNPKNKAGATPLKLASLVNKLEVIRALVAAGADVEEVDEEGYTALHFAAGMGNLDVVKFLVEDCSSNVHLKNRDGHTPIFCACFAGKEAVVRYLATHHPATLRTRNLQGDTLLHCACTVQHPESLVRLLLGLGSRATALNKRGQTPLDAAEAMMQKSGRDLTPVLQILEDSARQETDVAESQPDEPPHALTVDGLLRAASRGDLAEMLVYFRGGFSVNSKDSEHITCLHELAHNGYDDVIPLMISNSADVNAVTESGDTPLLLAAAEGHANVIPCLVRGRGDVNVRDGNNAAALHLSAAEGWLEATKILVEIEECDTLAEDNDGFIPLFLAVKNGHINVVSYLASADPDSLKVADGNGDTALHHAARGGPPLEATIKVLLDKGALAWTGNQKDETPLMIAQTTRCSKAILALLQAHEEREQGGLVNDIRTRHIPTQGMNAASPPSRGLKSRPYDSMSPNTPPNMYDNVVDEEHRRMARELALRKAEEARLRVLGNDGTGTPNATNRSNNSKDINKDGNVSSRYGLAARRSEGQNAASKEENNSNSNIIAPSIVAEIAPPSPVAGSPLTHSVDLASKTAAAAKSASVSSKLALQQHNSLPAVQPISNASILMDRYKRTPAKTPIPADILASKSPDGPTASPIVNSPSSPVVDSSLPAISTNSTGSPSVAGRYKRPGQK